MTEYYTKGLVLERHLRGEFDESITIYTKGLGKISSFVKSTKKPESKLSPHLNVGKIARVRIIKTNNYKIVDAISEGGALNPESLKFIEFIRSMTPYEEPDPHLWHAIEYVVTNIFNRSFMPLEKVYPPKFFEEKLRRVNRRFLEIFGFGAKFARCNECENPKVSYFHPPMLVFLCSDSLKKLSINEEEVVQI